MRAAKGGRTYPGAGAAVALLLLLSACGGSGGHGGPGSSGGTGTSGGSAGTASAGAASSTSSSTAAPPEGAYDPPLRFGPHGVRLPLPQAVGAGGSAAPLPIALHGTDAYVAGATDMRVVSTLTGTVLATVHAQGRPPGGAVTVGPASAPLVATIGDSTLSLALVPFLVTAAAQGSTPAGTAIELVAVDTSTRQTVWTAQIGGLPAWASDGSSAGLTVDMVGISGNVAVVQVSGAGVVGAAVGIDLMKHQAIWDKDGFAAGAVTDGAVVGRVAAKSKDGGSAVAALDTTDGDQLWKELDAGTITVGSAAPGKVVLSGTGTDGTAFGYLVDAKDGTKTALTAPGTTLGPCSYDDASVLVCTARDGSGAHLLGLDATSGKQLWQLPTGTPSSGTPGGGTGGSGTPGLAAGAVPTVTAVRHGAVYASTGAVPVVLDARTGAVRSAAPGVAPRLLDGDVGLSVPATGGPVTAYPAVG